MGHRNNFGLHNWASEAQAYFKWAYLDHFQLNWASGAQTYFKRAYRAHLFANQPTIHPTQKPTKHSNHQSAQTQQIKPATHPPSKTSQPTSTPEPSRSTNKETEEIHTINTENNVMPVNCATTTKNNWKKKHQRQACIQYSTSD